MRIAASVPPPKANATGTPTIPTYGPPTTARGGSFASGGQGTVKDAESPFASAASTAYVPGAVAASTATSKRSASGETW